MELDSNIRLESISVEWEKLMVILGILFLQNSSEYQKKFQQKFTIIVWWPILSPPSPTF